MEKDKNKILIIEDETDLRDLLASHFIDDFKLECLTASNGQEGYELLRANPDCTAIFSDIHMPEINGLEFLKKIRDEGIETPLVFLTAHDDQENTVKALRLGAFDFIGKPIDFHQIDEIAAEAIELGVALKNLESELQSLFESMGQGENQESKEETRRKYKALLRIRVENTIRFKKKAA